jgi:hypothetical protein
MSMYVTLVAGESLGHPKLRDYGARRVQSLYDTTMQNGGFVEFNSPAYTPLTLNELSRLRAHVQTEQVGLCMSVVLCAGACVLHRLCDYRFEGPSPL